MITARERQRGRGGGWRRRCISKKTGGKEEQSGETAENRQREDRVNRGQCMWRTGERRGAKSLKERKEVVEEGGKMGK